MIKFMVLLGLVYFSRTGEQYSVGNITEGNTAIVAGMIADKTGGSLFEIKFADDVYPAGYSELIKFAQKEKRQKARPAITGTVDNFAEYDTVFIGYPNWWAEMPMPFPAGRSSETSAEPSSPTVRTTPVRSVRKLPCRRL